MYANVILRKQLIQCVITTRLLFKVPASLGGSDLSLLSLCSWWSVSYFTYSSTHVWLIPYKLYGIRDTHIRDNSFFFSQNKTKLLRNVQWKVPFVNLQNQKERTQSTGCTSSLWTWILRWIIRNIWTLSTRLFSISLTIR